MVSVVAYESLMKGNAMPQILILNGSPSAESRTEYEGRTLRSHLGLREPQAPGENT